MIVLIYIQNLTVIGPVVSEIIRHTKIGTDDRQTDRRKQETYFFVRQGSCKVEKTHRKADSDKKNEFKTRLSKNTKEPNFVKKLC